MFGVFLKCCKLWGMEENLLFIVNSQRDRSLEVHCAFWECQGTRSPELVGMSLGK
jgi:hypothetical protein